MSDNLSDIRVHLIESWDEVQEFMTWLGERRLALAVDLETEGIDWWSDNIRTAQFGDTLRGWTIPYDRWSGLVEEIALRYEGEFVMHNGQFDRKFMERDGIYFPADRTHDTMLQAHIIEPDMPVGLKELADRKVSMASSHGQKMLKQFMKTSKTNWATVPITEPSYWGYGGLDVVFTARIHEIQMQYMHGKNADVYDLERAAGEVLMRMSQKGFRVDIPYVKEQIASLLGEEQDIAFEAEKEYGVTRMGSTPQITEALMKDGWSPVVKTPTGRPKLNEEILKTIDHPLAKLVTAYRFARKVRSSYFENFLTLEHEGRIHCDIRQLGARTGRMSVSRPSLQNPPRGELVRNAFIPSEGHLLAAIDYSSIELRLAADHANEVSMIRAYHEGVDMHTHNAALMFKITMDEVTPHQRQVSKNISFGKLYGAGVGKLAEQLGVSMEEANSFMVAYNVAFPYLAAYMRELSDKGKERAKKYGVKPYTFTEMGRYQPTKAGTEYRLTNYRTQGTAADILKQTIVNLDAAGLGPYMLLPIHDEVCFEFPEGDAQELFNRATEVMTISDRKVPLIVEGSIGNRWGQLK